MYRRVYSRDVGLDYETKTTFSRYYADFKSDAVDLIWFNLLLHSVTQFIEHFVGLFNTFHTHTFMKGGVDKYFLSIQYYAAYFLLLFLLVLLSRKSDCTTLCFSSVVTAGVPSKEPCLVPPLLLLDLDRSL